MKKKVKRIFIIIAVVCFFLLFFSNPRTAFAVGGSDYAEMAWEITNDYFEHIETNQQAILSQFFTYAYVSVVENRQGVEKQYDYCLVISSSTQYQNKIVYNCGNGSGYYVKGQTGFLPRVPTVIVYSDYITISGNYYYFDPVAHPSQYVVYCDLPTTYYNDHTDPLSLQHIIVPFKIPAPSIAISKEGSLEDVIKEDLDRWKPQPTTTLPPFIPPATLPPATLPPDIVTICPPATDIDGSYIIDYQPYIYGDFAPITTLQDDTVISASGSIIAYSWNTLTSDEQIKSIVLLILALSLVLGLLT